MAKKKQTADDPSTSTPLEPAVPDASRALDVGGSSLLESVRPHIIKVIVVLIGVGAALGAAAGYSWLKHRRDAKATLLFGEVTDVLSREVKAPPPPGEPVSAPAAADPDAEPTYTSAADRATATLAAIERLRKEAGDSGVSKAASLLAAGQLYDLGKWDEAAAAYREAAVQVAPTLQPLAREGLGYALESKALAGDAAARPDLLKQAQTAFAAIQPDATGVGRDRALYHQARVLAQLGDGAAARTLFQELIDTFPKSELVTEATARLAVVEFK